MAYGQYNPWMAGPYVPGAPQFAPQPAQQYAPQQPATAHVKVDGPVEALNRLVLTYPAAQLVPGFVSDPVFDVNGRQFHTLSIEADGRRNLETFDFSPHVEEPAPEPAGTVPREEFDALAARLEELAATVDSMRGGRNGVHEPVRDGRPAAAGAHARPSAV